jgi:hypothetical protein
MVIVGAGGLSRRNPGEAGSRLLGGGVVNPKFEIRNPKSRNECDVVLQKII